MHLQQVLAYRHAEIRQGTHREVTRGNSANQRSEPSYIEGGKRMPDAEGNHARRPQRLQDILDELVALTEWKKL